MPISGKGSFFVLGFCLITLIIAGCSGQRVVPSDVTTTTVNATTTSSTSTTIIGVIRYTFNGGVAGDHFGQAVGRAGTRLVVGAPLADPGSKVDAGAVYVYSSGGTAETYSPLQGAAAGNYFGYSVAGTTENIVVGAPMAEHAVLMTDEGKAYLFTASDGSEQVSVHGEAVDDQLGYAVSPYGSNFLAGSYGYSSYSGKGYKFSGATGAVLFQATGEAIDSGFGAAVANAGDVNGGGTDDLLFGAPLYDDGGAQTADKGAAYVYLGEAPNTQKYKKTGQAAGDKFGCAVAGLGPCYESGFSDFAVGAYLAGSSGRVYVYRGRNGEVMYTVSGEASGNQFGFSIANAGDVNGDGKNDLIVGAPLADKAYVYNGVDGTLIYSVSGTNGERFGYAVSGAGDLNGDGRADVMVGAPFADPSGAIDAGKVYVYVSQ